MTRSTYAKLTRNVFRWLSIALALGCFQINANSASLSKANTSIPYNSNGKTIDFGTGSRSSVIPPNASVPAGSTKIGDSGWHYGTGAASAPASGQTMTMGANGEVYLAGTKYPHQAGYDVPVSSIGAAALGLVGGWPGLAIGVSMAAYPHIKKWFDDAGVSPNPDAVGQGDAWLVREPDGCYSDCYTYKANTFPITGNTPEAVCSAIAAARGYTGAWYMTNGKSQCVLGSTGTEGVARDKPRRADDELPKSMDDIAPYLNRTPFSPAIIGDIYSGGGTIGLPLPNITGPSAINGEPTTNTTTGSQTINGQQVPTKTTTTSQTTYNFTTNNNQVTNTHNTTTKTETTVNQSTGVVIGTSTSVTETTPEEKDERTECEKNPKQLSCAELDTPDGEIPKAKVSVTYSIEDSWGGGSCPADVYAKAGNQMVKAYDWQQTCSYVSTYVRPILLLLCAFGALWIVIPGKADS